MQLVLIILLLVLGLDSYTSAQSLHHQTLSAMGSHSLSLSSGLRVQQSIGQSSITGTFNTNSIYLSQGFLRGINAPKKEIRPRFGAIAFPNAFTEHISFRFTMAHDELTQVLIYDSQGKKVYEQLHLPKNQEIGVQLPQHPPGLYIVKLSSGLLNTQLRVLKKN